MGAEGGTEEYPKLFRGPPAQPGGLPPKDAWWRDLLPAWVIGNVTRARAKLPGSLPGPQALRTLAGRAVICAGIKLGLFSLEDGAGRGEENPGTPPLHQERPLGPPHTLPTHLLSNPPRPPGLMVQVWDWRGLEVWVCLDPKGTALGSPPHRLDTVVHLQSRPRVPSSHSISALHSSASTSLLFHPHVMNLSSFSGRKRCQERGIGRPRQPERVQ